jgi:hypothetical protein
MIASPEGELSKVVNNFIAVVFPAPFDTSKENIPP